MTLIRSEVFGKAEPVKTDLEKLSIGYRYVRFLDYFSDAQNWQCSARARAALCSLALGAGLANSLRLPGQAAVHGGPPFLAALALLAAVAGLPLAFLELGLGRFGQLGALKLWRALPILKGLGYVKLFASFLVAVYYMIYVSLTTALLIWSAKGPLPLAECRELHRGLDGYHVNGTSGQKCINKTFLKPVFEDPMWYSIIAAIMFTFWLLIPLCLIKVPQSFQKCLYVFGGATIALSTIIALMGDSLGLKSYFFNANWDLLLSANLWYAAFIQLLFSTHLGFGYLITTAGTIYYQSNIFWSALTFIVWNIVFGWFSVFLWQSIEDTQNNQEGSALLIMVLIYDSSVLKDIKSLRPLLSYLLLIFSGLTSVLVFLYPVVWCIHTESHCKKTSIAWFIAIFGVFMSLAVFIPGFDIIRLLDTDIVPMYIMVSVLIELIGLFLIYGFKSIKQDLEFIVDENINYCWFVFWSLLPITLGLLILWKVAHYAGKWNHKGWVSWLMISMFLLAIINLVVWAAWVIFHKEDYGFYQKFKSATKPSRKWGPAEPILRHRWLQYKSSKRESESRDIKVTKMKPVNYKMQNFCNHSSSNCETSAKRSKKDHRIDDFTLHNMRSKKNNTPQSARDVDVQESCSQECQKARHDVYQCEVNYYSHSCWTDEECSTEF